MPNGSDIVYRVDDSDRIIFVNDEWDIFAAANEGDAILSSRVLGCPLWDFIEDATTRHIYRLLMSRTRSGHPLQFPFRCDSQFLRRLLEMNLTRLPEGTVEFCTRTIQTEAHDTAGLLHSGAHDPEEMLRMCSWCKRVFADDYWWEIEEAVGCLPILRDRLPPSITHGMCDRCYAKMSESLLEN